MVSGGFPIYKLYELSYNLKRCYRRNNTKFNLRVIGKIGFLLVISGFFMPVACDRNGFQMANHFLGYSLDSFNFVLGILMYVMFASAISGIVIGVLLLKNKNISVKVDLAIIFVCILCGLTVYFSSILSLQIGAHFILTGWIIELICQLIFKIKKINNK